MTNLNLRAGHKFFIYSIFLFIGLNIKIMPGFYFYNLLIVFFLAINYSNLKINKQAYNLVIILSFWLLTTLITQIFYFDTFWLDAYYVVLNMLILLSYLFFIPLINFRVLNYSIVLFFVATPIVLSILMFFNNGIEQVLLSFYGVGGYPAFGRYGGIFGVDVNALGLYASFTLLLNMILYKYNKVHLTLSFFVISISIFAISISGMRTGLLVLFGLLLIMNFRLKVLNYKILLFYACFLLATLLILYNYNTSSQVLIDYILNRFSISHLINELNANEGGGNLRHAIAYFYRVIDGLEFNVYTVLFGLNPSLNFMDNFYIFLFLKHGLLATILFLILSLYSIFLTIQHSNYIGLYFLLVSLVMAFKGLFIINNFYMFIVLFMAYFYRTYENTNKARS